MEVTVGVQVYVSPATTTEGVAVRVAVPPPALHITDGVAVAVRVGVFTVTNTVPETPQPPGCDAVIVYTVVAPGAAVVVLLLGEVTVGDQVYVSPPTVGVDIALRFTVVPAQTTDGVAEAAMVAKAGSMVTVTVLVWLHPKLVTVRV